MAKSMREESRSVSQLSRKFEVGVVQAGLVVGHYIQHQTCRSNPFHRTKSSQTSHNARCPTITTTCRIQEQQNSILTLRGVLTMRSFLAISLCERRSAAADGRQ